MKTKGMIVIGMVLWFFLGGFVLSPSASAANLVDNGNGTVTDPDTGLMWASKAKSNVSWGEAESYCQGYHGGGHSGWRMPTIDELSTINSKRWPLIDVGGSSFVWSSTLRDPEPSWLRGKQAAVYDYREYKVIWMLQISTHSGTVSALPVRNAR